MDMLQLFASPAGRALLASDNRPRGSTSTSSLSRESSSRFKSGRRPSGTGTVSAPTSPPRRRKSSAELYKEAVEILGLTCSLTDSCRCIDCQVINQLALDLETLFESFARSYAILDKNRKTHRTCDTSSNVM